MSTATRKVDLFDEPTIRALLQRLRFRFITADHAFWRARNNTATITLYQTGKLLIQSRSSGSLNELLFGTEQRRQEASFTKWIGTDESGKGDYFGPLTIAGVLATRQTVNELLRLGVRDSKRLSDTTIKTIAPRIKQLCPHSVATITPSQYNDLYLRMRNLNRLLAWGHARVIEVILSNHPCGHAITDQFGDESYLRKALMEKGRQITLIQRHHAEDDAGVAAASILAREAFLNGLETLSTKYAIDLPKGASQTVIEAGRRFVARYARAKLKEVAKTHFATTQDILDPKSEAALLDFSDDEFLDSIVKKRLEIG